jgi:hypothetical protein
MKSEIIERLLARVAELSAEFEEMRHERDEARARAAAAYEAAAQVCDVMQCADAARVIRGGIRAPDEDALTAALEKARAEERKRCAEVVESFAKQADAYAELADLQPFKRLSEQDAKILRIVARAIRNTGETT